ncbi:unnamed protein product, partial [Didymodactylos carnosus]
YSDHLSQLNIGRLISIGFKQWVHVGCILAAYSSQTSQQQSTSLDDPPYILRNIKELIKQCQSKYTCHLCHKQGASVVCCERDCSTRYHCDCIQKYYAQQQQQQMSQLNLVNGTLASLQTYCVKHHKKLNEETVINEQIERINKESNSLHSNMSLKSINLSSTIYGDLNRELIELNLQDLNLCIGSLQIHSIGNYNLLLDDDFDSDDCESNLSDNDDDECEEKTTNKHLKMSHIYPDSYHSSRLYWSTKCAKTKTAYHLYISYENKYHDMRKNHRTYEYGTYEQKRQQIIYEKCQKYFKQLQMKIDEHRKKVKLLSSLSTEKMTNHQQKQTSNIQSNKEKKKMNNKSKMTKTRELITSSSMLSTTKNVSSTVKRQTPKSTIQNIRRPRDNNQHHKSSIKTNYQSLPSTNSKSYDNNTNNDQLNHLILSSSSARNHNSLTMKPSNHYYNRTYSPNKSKESTTFQSHTSNAQISPLPFAVLLAKALQQIQPAILAKDSPPSTPPSHTSILNYYLSNQQSNKTGDDYNINHNQQHSPSIHTISSDELMQNLWKPINSNKNNTEASQEHQLNVIDSLYLSKNDTSQILLETDNILLANIVLSSKHKQHQQFLKDCLPQLDGCLDVIGDDSNDMDYNTIRQIIDSLLDQIEQTIHQRTSGEHSLDLNTKDQLVNLNNLMEFEAPPVYVNKLQQQFSKDKPLQQQKREKLNADEIIEEYKRWKKLKHSQIKFRIQSDDGYEIISDDLNQAWTTIVNLVRETRDDMKLSHLPLTFYDGHDAFGLNKTIVKTLLKQLQICTIKNYFQTQTTKKISSESQLSSISVLPLSTSSTTCLKTMKIIVKQNEWYRKLILYKKQLKKQHRQFSKSTVYERKSHKRQRFGWLLNSSRKISYAKETFEIDDALLHARRIILEESSVSLRLYHLHYFSERCLLVGHSPIHGCGLFTLIDILEGQMIIEYSGEVIRPCLTDKRERENEGK